MFSKRKSLNQGPPGTPPMVGGEHVQVRLEVLSVKHLGPVYEITGQFVNRQVRDGVGR